MKLFLDRPRSQNPCKEIFLDDLDKETKAKLAEEARLFNHFLETGEIKPTNQELIDNYLGQKGVLQIISDQELTTEIIDQITKTL